MNFDINLLLDTAMSMNKEISDSGFSVSIELKNMKESFDLFVKAEPIKNASRKLFLDGHYAKSVEEAFICIDNLVSEKSGISDSGKSLMMNVFNKENPKLKLNSLRSENDKNEQEGYRYIFAGSMIGIRNPRAHKHKFFDKPETALELLLLASHLCKKIEQSEKIRKKRIKTP